MGLFIEIAFPLAERGYGALCAQHQPQTKK